MTDTLIIGGGLAGLALADMLQSAGHDFDLVDARPRLGGRIMTNVHGAQHYDMGPAWFWSGQPRMQSLIARFALRQFEQHSDGILTFEDEQGQIQRGRGFASMEGSYRLEGGFTALVNALAAQLPKDSLHLGHVVNSIARTETGVTATLEDGREITARQIVLAVPPRIVGQIEFQPALPDAAKAALDSIPTWMAGQAKAMAVYDRPFWREAGLSGDAMSRFGPMVEVHDASPATGGSFALFGFIGVPPQARRNTDQLRRQITAQLIRLFGHNAGQPSALFIKDWAADPHTATTADLAPVYAHPSYALPTALANLWDGRLVLGGTEVAPQFGGYLEGALEAAENAMQLLDMPREGALNVL